MLYEEGSIVCFYVTAAMGVRTGEVQRSTKLG